MHKKEVLPMQPDIRKPATRDEEAPAGGEEPGPASTTWKNQPRSAFGALPAIRQGSGTGVLLLHGVGLRAEAWNAQIEAFAKQFAVIAPDMPGHGESAALSGLPTLAAYTDGIAAGLNEPVFVAGHSMGAMIALDLAIRYPERVRAVAALNAIYRRIPQARRAIQQRAASLDGVSISDPSATLVRWFGDARSAQAEACRDWLTNVNPAGYKVAYTVFAREDGPADEGLANLQCPALFMTGAQEPNSTPAMSEAMAELTPNGRAIIVAGAAHMMPMTNAAEVNAALIDFFTECDQ
jgi:pimeloyl-ACP methyl ester carboxylesterase